LIHHGETQRGLTLSAETEYSLATDHALQWAERLQEAVDGQLPAVEIAELSDHLGSCSPCATDFLHLQSLNATLTAELRASVTSDFDAKLFARIAEFEHSQLLKARERECNAHQQRIARLLRAWQSYWRFQIGNLVGAATLLAATFATFLPPGSTSEPAFLLRPEIASPLLLVVAASAVTWGLRVSRNA
jgi:anti-sigma factor RsiW